MSANLVPFKAIAPGGFFSVKSHTYGDIAFKKQEGDEKSPTRLHDGQFYDPTFGEDTIVRFLPRELAIRITDDNRRRLA